MRFWTRKEHKKEQLFCEKLIKLAIFWKNYEITIDILKVKKWKKLA